MIPSRISGWPTRAFSLAMRRSQLIASSSPPPSAKPFTAAITGRGIAATPSKAARNERSMCFAAAWSPNSLMSAPAANAFSPPSTTTAFTASSLAKLSAAPAISASNAWESAFIGGRLRRSVATPSARTSVSTSSVMGGAYRSTRDQSPRSSCAAA